MRRSMNRGLARILAILLSVVVVAAPATAQATISEQYELAVGREVAAQLISQYGHVSDGEWVGFLGQIRDRLVPFSGRPDIPAAVTLLAGQAVLASPDGELPIRFLRSTLPGEVPGRSQISGVLMFEKKSSQWPTALAMPVVQPDARIDLRLDLTAGGAYAPPASRDALPRSPALP